MEQKLTYNLAVRLFSDEKCFGPGVAQLLHRVQELHSLRAAAMSIGMAYSKAMDGVYTLIDLNKDNTDKNRGIPLEQFLNVLLPKKEK